jgi:V8-like Glu-specific endopeptidase
MKFNARAIIFAAITLAAPVAALHAGNKGIYGTDDRKDYYEVGRVWQAQADSVASLWDVSMVSKVSGGGYLLSTRMFGNKIFNMQGDKFCPSEPFLDQPTGAMCSGTLVGDDLLLTAGHCINSQHDCDSMKAVFGFNIRTYGGKAPTMVPDSAVYSCKEVVASKNEASPRAAAAYGGALHDLDYAVIRLDRKVIGRKPLPLDRGAEVEKGTPLMTIGHPVGLPAKIAGGAEVLNPRTGEAFFDANLDTYHGNSGSGVFNARTGLLVGILARGRDDFKQTPAGCFVSSVLPDKPADGAESVTKVSLVAGFIPELPAADRSAAAPKAAARPAR